MSPALANFIFEAANFLILAAALGWVLFKPVRSALDAERQQRERSAAEIDRLRAEAETLARQARASAASVEAEGSARRAELLAAAQSEAARLQEAARAARDKERSEFEGELAALRAAQAVALADEVGRIAAESLAALLAALDGPSLDLALVRGACIELSARSQDSRGSFLVESARPLESGAAALLRDALATDYEARVVPALGAGVRVTTQSGQVDATAVALTRHLARALQTTAREASAVPAVGDV